MSTITTSPDTSPDALSTPGPPPVVSKRRLNTLPLVGPSVGVLLLWMIVPLVMTLWFSFQRYNLLDPTISGFAGIDNYEFLVTDPDFWVSLTNTLLLVGSVLVITVVGGTLLAVLFDQHFPGRGVARLLAIAPFFVMPTVSALIWKNLMMHPINGVFARGSGLVRLAAGRLVRRVPAAVGHHDRVVAVAAVRAR